MNDEFDERMNELLRRHFAERLDGHVGSAAERFRRHISGASAARGAGYQPVPENGDDQHGLAGRATMELSELSRRHRGGPRFGSLWTIGIVGGALAAAVTIVSMRHVILPSQPKSRPSIAGMSNRDAIGAIPDGVVPDGPPLPVRQASMDVALRTIDEGVVPLGDGTPARRLLQQRTDTLRWYDPKRRAQIEYTAPRQPQTVYVGYNAH